MIGDQKAWRARQPHCLMAERSGGYVMCLCGYVFVCFCLCEFVFVCVFE